MGKDYMDKPRFSRPKNKANSNQIKLVLSAVEWSQFVSPAVIAGVELLGDAGYNRWLDSAGQLLCSASLVKSIEYKDYKNLCLRT